MLSCMLPPSFFIVLLSYMSLLASWLAYSADTGALLISLSNGINAVSRILMEYLADRVGRQNTMVVTLFLADLASSLSG